MKNYRFLSCESKASILCKPRRPLEMKNFIRWSGIDAVLGGFVDAAMEIEKGEYIVNTEYRQHGKGFWVRWVVASAIGLFVGFVIYFFSVDSIAAEQGFILKTLISAVAGAIFGAAVGGAQLFVLRRKVSGMKRWMLASIIGAAIGGIFALPISEAVGDATNFNIAISAGGIVLGLAFGIGQAVVLRSYLSEGIWWALAHAVGIPFGYVLGRGLGEVTYNLLVGGIGEDIARVIGVLIFAVLFFGGYGMITGGVLIRLLKQPGSVAPA